MRQGSNLQPSGSKPDALTDCATHPYIFTYMSDLLFWRSKPDQRPLIDSAIDDRKEAIYGLIVNWNKKAKEMRTTGIEPALDEFGIRCTTFMLRPLLCYSDKTRPP